MHSDLGEGGDSIGANGETDIIRKITIDVPPGQIVHDFRSTVLDGVTIPKGSYQRLAFRLTNYENKGIDMGDLPINFSVIFVADE